MQETESFGGEHANNVVNLQLPSKVQFSRSIGKLDYCGIDGDFVNYDILI